MFNMLTKLVFVLLIIVGYCNRREKQETKEEQWWVERRGQGKRKCKIQISTKETCQTNIGI